MNFKSLKISNGVLNTLKNVGITEMTPIQEKCLPISLSNKNILGKLKSKRNDRFRKNISIPTSNTK